MQRSIAAILLPLGSAMAVSLLPQPMVMEPIGKRTPMLDGQAHQQASFRTQL